jgi:hypothetical protein
MASCMEIMNTMRGAWLGLLAIIATVTVTSTPAATRSIAQRSAGRDAAIYRCSVLARRLYPEQEWDMRQSDLYKACVSAAGFQP